MRKHIDHAIYGTRLSRRWSQFLHFVIIFVAIKTKLHAAVYYYYIDYIEKEEVESV
jgi:hypothetical protein